MIKLKDNPIEGQEISMGGSMMNIPALNFRQIKTLSPDIKKMENADTDEKRLAAQIKVIHQAIKRNYPDATIEDVEDIVDMTNILRVMAAVMGQKFQDPTEGKGTPATL